jgi:single-strand DNA-binding protein
MANDLNKVFLIARLTRDPDYKLVGGTSLVNFGVANNRSYMVNGEKREETHYFDCEAWGKLADIIRQYANKGKQVMIEGRLKYDSWDSPEGKKQSRVRIVVENLQLLGSPQGGGGSPGPYPHSIEREGEPNRTQNDGGYVHPENDNGSYDNDEPF